MGVTGVAHDERRRRGDLAPPIGLLLIHRNSGG
jgi:hypothetical protein